MKNSQLFIRLTLLSVILPLFLSSCIKIQGQQEEYKPQTIDGYDYTPLLQVEIPDDVKSQLKNYSGYTVSFNADNGTANWVAWALTPERVDGPISRKGKKFWTDEEITSCPDTRSYTNSGFDRGHLCPAADNKINEEMMNDCFSLANIVSFPV